MFRQARACRENRGCYVQYKKPKPRKQADFAERHRTELALYSHAEREMGDTAGAATVTVQTHVIPASEKVFQIHWRSRAYTGDHLGKSYRSRV